MIDVKQLSKDIKTPWGEIGYITFKRTYSRRLKEDDVNSKTEEFWQVIQREIEASDKQLKVGFTDEEKIRYAQTRLQLKWSVAGRFMWQLGTKTVDRLGLPSLQNCAAVVVNEPVRPFTWAFEMLMLGSGVGYNIQRHNVYQLPKVKSKVKIVREDTGDADFIVPDSREGWVKLLAKVLKAHFYSGEGFTYSAQLIRSKGAPIKGFGGSASGPEELCWGIAEISKILNNRSNKKLRPIDCLDIMNIIGFIVVSGNVRRSAQLAIGDYDDIDFLTAKRWDLGTIPKWRGMSNNSIAAPENLDKLPKEFWDTYQQGEPYGLINIELSKEVGRTGETQYPDPNVEVYNPCVIGETEILTKEGYKRIDSLINTEVEIWNGFEWSKVTPKITGNNQHVIKITLSDGRELTSTDYHKWYLAEGYTSKNRETSTNRLKIGDKIIKYNFPILKEGEQISLRHAYTQGFISAEGMDDYKYFWLYESKYMCKDRLDIRLEGAEFKNINEVGRKTIYYTDVYNNKSYVPFEWCLTSKMEWLSGLFDGDATELIEGGLQICSTELSFLNNLQKLLSTLGINSKIVSGNEEGNRMLPDGKGGSKEYFCNTSYRLCVGATQIQDLKSLGLQCSRLKFEKSPQRDASQFVKVIKIEDGGYVPDVYCFNEPLRHFGVFNGILTGQCAEQSLINKETCCLGLVFLPNINNYEEFQECLKFSYRMCKHSLALHCSIKDTGEIVNKYMRMGIGLPGWLQATEEQRSWASKAYEWLRGYDKWYSGEKGFPESIKLTTSKPDGTGALIPGVLPGCMPSPAPSQYYWRTMRISTQSPLVEVCRKNGYKIEQNLNIDGSIDYNTMVVYFPCKLADGVPNSSAFTWREQLDTIRRVQKEWSDNSVSCTIYYNKEDIEDIKEYLKEHFRYEIKTVSFLLFHGHGFKQAPYIPITKEEYESEIVKIKPIINIDSIEESLETSECENGACPIK